MMKFLLSLVFMNFMVGVNGMLMFYYNVMFLYSLGIMFLMMYKEELWFNFSLISACNMYSLMLILLSYWIVALMIMSIEVYNKALMSVFINLLVILVMYFSLLDVFLFYLSFEVSLVPIFFLIVYWGSYVERVSAAWYMFMYMLFMSFPLLVYIFDMYMYSLSLKFSVMKLFMESYEISLGGFVLIYMAFFIKMPLYLFHLWLPKAHVEAPVYGSMILAGVLLKMGGYGLIQFMLLMGKASMKYNILIISISVVGSILMSVSCLSQVDMKSLVAYSSVVHMNMMLVGLMMMFKLGVLASGVVMIAHGLCSSGLFYMVGLIYKVSNSRMMVLNKGILTIMSSMIMWWFLFNMANFSFPFSLNFMGELLLLMVILSGDKWLMINLMMICFFSGCYSLYLYSYISHGVTYYQNFKGVSFGMLKEYMVLIMHFFPLLMLMLNMNVLL